MGDVGDYAEYLLAEAQGLGRDDWPEAARYPDNNDHGTAPAPNLPPADPTLLVSDLECVDEYFTDSDEFEEEDEEDIEERYGHEYEWEGWESVYRFNVNQGRGRPYALDLDEVTVREDYAEWGPITSFVIEHPYRLWPLVVDVTTGRDVRYTIRSMSWNAQHLSRQYMAHALGGCPGNTQNPALTRLFPRCA